MQYSILTSYFSSRTHWKTTSCKPSSPEEELAAERSPTGSSSGYDYCPSIASGKWFGEWESAVLVPGYILTS